MIKHGTAVAAGAAGALMAVALMGAAGGAGASCATERVMDAGGKTTSALR